MAKNKKQSGAFLKREMSEGAFVKRVSAVSLAIVLVLVALAGAAWKNLDTIYASYASMQAGWGDYPGAVKTAQKIGMEEQRLESQYAIGTSMYEAGAYEEAAAVFESLGSYGDSAQRRLMCSYAQADQLYQSGAYEEALAAFAALGSYSDSVQRQQQVIYAMAEAAISSGDLAAALPLYLSVADYEDSYDKAFSAALSLTGDEDLAESMLKSGGQTPETLEKILKITQRRGLFSNAAISAGAYHTVVLYEDGTVAACGDDSYGQCQVGDWRDIVQISTGAYHTVGLKADGTLVATGKNDQGQCDVGGLTQIVQIAAGDSDTYALNGAGQVFIQGYHSYESITRAVDVRNIYAGAYSAVAETANGTFISSHKSGAIKPGSQVLSVGLNTGYVLTQYMDGTLTSTFDVGGDWKDIVSFDAGPTAILAADLNGKVRAHFFRDGDAVDVSGLEGVVQCAAGTSHFVFLTEDGKLIALGDDSYGQCGVDALKQVREEEEGQS